MAQQTFYELVDAIEQKYAGAEVALARRATLVAILGYAGIFLWVVAITSVSVGLFVGALFAPPPFGAILIALGAVVLALAIWEIFAALGDSDSKDAAAAINLRDAPHLAATLNRLQRDLQTPAIHQVFATVEFNAGVSQRLQFGLPWLTRNTLRVGLPLFAMLSQAEGEAVLAHELAHVSAHHGRLSQWTYRTRQVWENLAARMQNAPTSGVERFSRRLLKTFCAWYWPRFHAYFLVTSRQHEFAADRLAAERVNADVYAQALLKIDLCGRRLNEQFWPELSRSVLHHAEPPENLTRKILDFLATPPAAADESRWRSQACAELTGAADSHPALKDRVRGVGASLANAQLQNFPSPPELSSARQLFETRWDSLRQAVDSAWRQHCERDWRARHGRAVTLAQRLKVLQASAVDQPTNAAQHLWEQACTEQELYGSDVAEATLRALLAQRPGHTAANLLLGKSLLERGDFAGLERLEQAATAPDESLATEALETLATFYQVTGRAAELRHIHQRLDQYSRNQEALATERFRISKADEFAPADLEPSARAVLTAQLAKQPNLEVAWIARKKRQLETQRPVFVLAVKSKPSGKNRASVAADAELVRALAARIRLPGSLLVVAPQGAMNNIYRKVVALPGSRIYG